MDLLPHLLPLSPQLCVESLTIDAETKQVTIDLHSVAPICSCPLCHAPADRIHSRYIRTIADLPWAELVVCLQLHVHKFFCDNPACTRKIFTERLPTLVAPSARRSVRLVRQQQLLGLALGGSAGARLGAALDQRVSRNTLLRLVRRLPLTPPAAPKIIGIDDWAWRKGQRYGTIVIDLEQHRPIAMLEDRDADSLAAWLRQHPGIRIVARDRAGIYAEAATKGAPQAIQVADRFHLLSNLADTLLSVFEQHVQRLGLSTAAGPIGELPSTVVERATPMVTEERVRTLPPPTPSPKHQAQADQRRAARLARYERVRELHAQGWPLRAIGRELGLNRNTVRTFVRASCFPERQPRSVQQPSVLDPFIPYLIERWNAGCRTGTVLWKEITARGYRGKRVMVFAFITRLRKALGIPAKNRTIRDGMVMVPRERPLTPRSAVWLVLQRPKERDEATTQQIAELRQAHDNLDEAITLAEGFADLLRTRNPSALDPWLEQAAVSTLKPFRGFAASLRRDYAAVRAGAELPWSTGPVEGSINRLKMVKRTMYGRAGFALLQRRVLLTG
jgi:transposase